MPSYGNVTNCIYAVVPLIFALIIMRWTGVQSGIFQAIANSRVGTLLRNFLVTFSQWSSLLRICAYIVFALALQLLSFFTAPFWVKTIRTNLFSKLSLHCWEMLVKSAVDDQAHSFREERILISMAKTTPVFHKGQRSHRFRLTEKRVMFAKMVLKPCGVVWSLACDFARIAVTPFQQLLGPRCSFVLCLVVCIPVLIAMIAIDLTKDIRSDLIRTILQMGFPIVVAILIDVPIRVAPGGSSLLHRMFVAPKWVFVSDPNKAGTFKFSGIWRIVTLASLVAGVLTNLLYPNIDRFPLIFGCVAAALLVPKNLGFR